MSVYVAYLCSRGYLPYKDIAGQYVALIKTLDLTHFSAQRVSVATQRAHSVDWVVTPPVLVKLQTYNIVKHSCSNLCIHRRRYNC